MEYIHIREDGSVDYQHDDALMNSMYHNVVGMGPGYGEVHVPQLAIVPAGNTHQGVPDDTTNELRQAVDRYWREKHLPWIQKRSAEFLAVASNG